MVHRDIKPGNFLFSCKANKGYLIDFNLSLVSDIFLLHLRDYLSANLFHIFTVLKELGKLILVFIVFWQDLHQKLGTMSKLYSYMRFLYLNMTLAWISLEDELVRLQRNILLLADNQLVKLQNEMSTLHVDFFATKKPEKLLFLDFLSF